MQVEIWSDVVCPWCYIGEERFAAALAGFDHADEVAVTFRSFELHPDERGDGVTLVPAAFARMTGAGESRARTMFARVTDVARGVGLGYDIEHAIAANTRDAHRLIHLAQDHGAQDAVVRALFAAHLCDGRDIQDHDELARVAVAAGLDEDEVREALAGDRYDEDVRRDEDLARAYGISGVPFFVLDGKYGISGAQEQAVFARALDQVWAETHPEPVALRPVGEAVPADAACGPDGCAI